MRLPWVLCAAWAWAWYGLSRAVWAEEAAGTYANECELYGDRGVAATAPVMQFQRRVTISLLPQNERLAGQMVIQSSSSGKTCELFILPKVLTIQCGKQKYEAPDASNIFSAEDVTDLWIDVDQGSGNNTPSTWELRLVGRRGGHRVHFLAPDTHLQPPFTLRWGMTQNIQYAFNCITGCLFLESVQLPAGDHTFSLRHDKDFIQMTLDCSITSSDDYKRELSINVTTDELGQPGGLKEITVVWLPDLGRVGVLVDGTPEGGTKYEPLMKKRQVNVTVSGGGGGLVAACDPGFQAVAGVDSEASTATTTTTSEPSTVSPPTSSTTPDPPTAAIIDHHHDGHSSQWLPATFTLVLLNLLVTLGAVILVTFLYFRTSDEPTQFSRENSGVLGIFTRQLSNRSSTRSQRRGSQRRNKDQNEAPLSDQGKVDRDHDGDMQATSDAAGQRQRVISADSLVKMELL